MACSKQPGPARTLKFIEEYDGSVVSQAEWHALRVLAVREEEGTGSRRRATPEEINRTLVGLTNIIASEQGFNHAPEEDDEGRPAIRYHPDFAGDWLNPIGDEEEWMEDTGRYEYFESCVQLEKDLKNTNVTVGTLEILDYMAAYGPSEALERARTEIKAQKEAKAAVKPPLGEWQANEGPSAAAVAAEVAVEADGDDILDDAVAARRRAAEKANATDGPYGKARVGSKYTGYRDAAEIARDVRSDLKQAKASGDIPADVGISVKTNKYAGGQAVDVTLKGWPVERVYEDFTDAYGMQSRRYTAEAKAIMDTVEAMREAYNRDASDSQMDYFDNTYYGHTRWDMY